MAMDNVLVRLEPPDVVRVDRFGEAVARASYLRCERPEHPVPDDEDATVVPIEILGIAPVMDAMVRRGVEHVLERPPHPVDVLGVNPELVDEVQRVREEDESRRHAEQGER